MEQTVGIEERNVVLGTLFGLLFKNKPLRSPAKKKIPPPENLMVNISRYLASEYRIKNLSVYRMVSLLFLRTGWIESFEIFRLHQPWSRTCPNVLSSRYLNSNEPFAREIFTARNEEIAPKKSPGNSRQS